MGPCPALEQAVCILLGPAGPEGTVGPGPQLALDLGPSPSGGWLLSVNDTPVLRLRSARELAPALEGLLVGWAVRTRAGCLALHGAGAGLGDRTALLVGASGRGKSSLCLALALRGARYLADELVFVRRDGLAVEAFPKAITLKRGSFALAPPSESHDDPGRGAIRYFTPGHRARMGELAPPPSLIVFPHFEKGCAGLRETRLGPEETAYRLVGQCFGGMGRLPGSLAAVARLAARGSWALGFSDTDAACRRIGRLAESA